MLASRATASLYGVAVSNSSGRKWIMLASVNARS
jgi:hypothetical protein